jgi:hypothetical protein
VRELDWESEWLSSFYTERRNKVFKFCPFLNNQDPSEHTNEVFPNKLKFNICFFNRACINQYSILNAQEISAFCGDMFTTERWYNMLSRHRIVSSISLSCHLRVARSHLKQRVESYRKLIVSTLYLKYHAVWQLPYTVTFAHTASVCQYCSQCTSNAKYDTPPHFTFSK